VSDVYRIVYDRLRQQWSVHRTGEFARFCESFDTLAAAEEYVCSREPEVET
jgi:hypothetical protein